MKNKTSIADKVLKILKENDATTKKLSEKLHVNENIIRTTINRMKKNDLIHEIGLYRNRYKVYRFGDPDEIKAERINMIQQEIVDKITNLVLNKNERKAVFKKYQYDSENLNDEEIDIKIGFFVETLFQMAKNELLDDFEFLDDLKKKLQKICKCPSLQIQ